jgi:hypothetical protein
MVQEDAILLIVCDGLAETVVNENLVILPECTGIWWLRV